MPVMPKRYRFEFIEPGIMDYTDTLPKDEQAEGRKARVLVTREFLDKIRASFIGCPVFNESHSDTAPEDAFQFYESMKGKTNEEKLDLADGVVSDIGTLPNGWDFADAMIWDEETQKNLDERGFTCSCAYTPDDFAGSGTYHGITYDEEPTEGHYDHLAIVDNPRYERSKAYENSKGVENMIVKPQWLTAMLNHTAKPKKNASEETPEEKKKREEEEVEKENSGGDSGKFINVNGKKMSLEDAVNCYKQKKNVVDDDSMLSPDDEIEIDGGEKIKVSDLIALLEQGGEDADDGMENADVTGQDEKGTVVKVMTNSRGKGDGKANENFTGLRNARAKAETAEFKPNFDMPSERLERGSERYGSKKKEGGK